MTTDARPTDTVAPEEVAAAQKMVETAHDVALGGGDGGGLNRLMKVGLTVTVELGRCRMKISDIVNMGSGSVVELQRLASEPVDIMVNGSLFARGEVVVIEDHFAVKITDLTDKAKVEDLG